LEFEREAKCLGVEFERFQEESLRKAHHYAKAPLVWSLKTKDLEADFCFAAKFRRMLLRNKRLTPKFPERLIQLQVFTHNADIFVAAAGDIHDHNFRLLHVRSALDNFGYGVSGL